MIPALLSVIALFACSVFVGNGFSPVFAVMKQTRRSRIPYICLAIFFAVKLAFDAGTGVLGFTLVQYPIWLLCYLVSRQSAVLSATVFFFLSNTLCFFQMNGSIPELATYEPSLAGYGACLLSGLPYYLRSLVATVLADVILVWLLRRAPATVKPIFPEPNFLPAI